MKGGFGWAYLDMIQEKFVEMASEDIRKIEKESSLSEAKPSDLFLIESDSIFLSIEKLIPTRCRVSGVINASKRMEEAKDGTRSKRNPLSVKFYPKKQKYIIIDGNSTYYACVMWGLGSVPCKLQN